MLQMILKLRTILKYKARTMWNFVLGLTVAVVPGSTQAVEEGQIPTQETAAQQQEAPAEAGRRAPAPGEEGAVSLGTVEVEAPSEPPTRFAAPVEGTQLFEGKRATVTPVEDLPPVANNNLRQLLSLTPGLLVSEVSNFSWASLSYRGLGEPHESWNLLVLKDGIPVSPDMFSYPAAYFTPPSESVERLEFIRGGASLLYGPQPGGALNYVSRLPARDRPFTATAKALYGSFDLATGYVAASGTAGRVGYLADVNYAGMGTGPRVENSDFANLNGNLLLALDADRSTRYFLRLDTYFSEFGEPGGLTLERFREDWRQVSTPDDRFRVQRHIASLNVQHDFSAGTLLDVKAWGGYYERTSRRQAGTRFGVLAAPENVSLVQRQLFYIGGATGRLRHDYQLGEAKQTLTVGLSLFGTNAPVFVDKGDSATDDEGRAGALSRTQRSTRAGGLYLENAFRVGRLSVVPGVRVDLVDQRVREELDLQVGSVTGGGPGQPNGELGNKTSSELVVLPGLGLSYDAGNYNEAYLNVTRGYKPKLFNDGVTFQAGINVAETFDPSHVWSGETGVRGQPLPYVTYDASLFYVNFENQVGLLGTDTGGAQRTNIGRMINWGGDLVLEVDVLGLATQSSRFGRLSVFGNVQLLSAELVNGPARGNRPQYAPPYLARTGVAYQLPPWVKVTLLGSLVGRHSGVDNNHPLFAIPSYQVVDLTGEFTVLPKVLSVVGGVNNLLDEVYWARVRPGGGGGIDPGLRRNFYVGFIGHL